MRLQTLARLSLAAAAALLLSGPAVLAAEAQVADVAATATPSVEQDQTGDDDNRTRGDGAGLTERKADSTPPRTDMPEDPSRRERLDRRIGDRPERTERVDRVGSDVPRPDVRPERSERPGIGGVRPNG